MPPKARPTLLVLHAVGAVQANWWIPRLAAIADLVTVYREDILESAHAAAQIESAGGARAVCEIDDIVDAALSTARDVRIDGVVTFSETLLAAAAEVAHALNLPHHAPDAVMRMQRKDLQRAALAHAGILGPRYTVLSSRTDIDNAAREIDFPAIIKPVSGYGSVAAFQVHAAHEASSVYSEAAKVRSADWRLASESPLFILEEFLEGSHWHKDQRMGDMVSVESLVFQGEISHLTVTDKFPPAFPFRETGDLMPSWLDRRQRAEIEAVTTAAIRAVEATHGALHTELKLTASGPQIIEINGRLGGFIARSMETVFGYDIVTEIGRVALGARPQRPGSAAGYVMCLNLMAPATDLMVTEITGQPQVEAMDQVTYIELAEAGTVPSWRFGGGCYGLIEAVGDAPETLLDAREEILASLRFELAGNGEKQQ
jgi:biotin carboxylase